MSRGSRKHRGRWLGLFVLAGGVALTAYLVATRPEQPTAPPGERIWRVEAAAVAPGPVAPELLLYGQVKAREDADLAAPGAAQVLRVAVRGGEAVSAGDVLVVLDPRDFEPAVRRAAAEVDDLEAQIERQRIKHEADLRTLDTARERVAIARAEVQRQRKLRTQGMGSDQALDQAREALARREQEWITKRLEIQSHEARLAQLEAGLEKARAAQETARLALERSVLRAPFDGVISEVDAAPGEWVQPGRTLVRVYNLGSLEVHARIPEPYRAVVQAALRGEERLRADTEGATLVLDRLAGEAGSAGVTGIFAPGAQAMRWSRRPGEVVALRLRLPDVPDAVALPASALYGGDTVYRVRDGRLERVVVEVVGHRRGPSGRTQTIVRSRRLHPADRIAITHLPQAVDGLRVEVVPAQDTDAAAGGGAS